MKSTSKIMLLGAIVGSFCFTGCDSEYSADAPSVSTVQSDPNDNGTITGVNATGSVTNTDNGVTLDGNTSVGVQDGQTTNDVVSTVSRSDDGATFTPSISSSFDPATNTLNLGISYSGTVGPNNDPITIGIQSSVNVSTGVVSGSVSVTLRF